MPKTLIRHTTAGNAHNTISARISVDVLSDGTNRYTTAVRLANNANGAAVVNNNQVWVQYTDNVNGGRWELYSRDGTNTSTGVDLGISVAADRVYNIMIVLDRQSTEA